MDGAVFLVGGGLPRHEAHVWRRAFAGRSRCLHVPFAPRGALLDEAVAYLTDTLDELEIDITVDTWATLDNHGPEQLAAYDIVHVTGGNAFRGLALMRLAGIVEPLRHFVERGGTYFGRGAGVHLACRDISGAHLVETDPIHLAELSSIGLVPHYSILPEATAEVGVAAERWSEREERAVLLLPQPSGVAFVDGTFEALGPALLSGVLGMRNRDYMAGDRWAGPLMPIHRDGVEDDGELGGISGGRPDLSPR